MSIIIMDKIYKNYIRPIIISISIIFWLKGAYRTLDFFIKDTMINNIVLITLSFLILYFVAGNFTILGNVTSIMPDSKKNNENDNK